MSINFNDTAIAFAGKNDRELKEARNLFKMMNNEKLVNMGTGITQWAFKVGFPISGPIRLTIFDHFCGGRDIEECKPAIQKLSSQGVFTILDYGVEAKNEEAELDETADYLEKTLEFAKADKDVNILSIKITGLFPDELLKKFSKGNKFTDEETEKWNKGKQRVDRVAKAAHDSDIQLYFDAEESWLQPAIDSLVTEAMKAYNKEKPIIFNTIQLYRHDRLAYLKSAYAEARLEDYILAVKLVRGAYMEKEREHAEAEHRPSPIQPDKESTDRDYNAALEFCMEYIANIAFCNATHNEESCRLLCELVENSVVRNDHPHIFTAQLFGMGDNLSFNMAKMGMNVAKYMPYGPVKEVVPYLMRRARENTSVNGSMSRELNLLQQEIERRRL